MNARESDPALPSGSVVESSIVTIVTTCWNGIFESAPFELDRLGYILQYVYEPPHVKSSDLEFRQLIFLNPTKSLVYKSGILLCKNKSTNSITTLEFPKFSPDTTYTQHNKISGEMSISIHEPTPFIPDMKGTHGMSYLGPKIRR